MPRRWERPSGGVLSGKPRSQLLGLVTLLMILGLIYARAKDPATWRWLAQDARAEDDAIAPRPAEPPVADRKAPRKPTDAIEPGPTDADSGEADAARRLFAAVTDKSRLEVAEMPAYWRLMTWARAQSFEDLAKRARDNVLITQLAEQPERYRGQPLKLRLHIKRVVEWDKVAKNPAGVERVFEAWGWTEDSKSYPYVVVFSELPPGMPIGGDVQAEGVFVGYFLKIMTYDAFEKTRAAPLLIGRLHAIDRPTVRKSGSDKQFWYWATGAAVLFIVGVRLWVGLSRGRRKLPSAPHGAGELTFEDWLAKSPPAESPDAGPTPPDKPTASL